MIVVHSDLAFASFEARLSASARLDDPRQFPKRGLLERDLAPIRRRGVVRVIKIVGYRLSD